jgi:methylmalonyl-CoA mutase C-terminal domain/subunit
LLFRNRDVIGDEEMTKRKGRIRVLVAKPGVDGHWRGAIVVSMALRDAGMEVIYGGNQTPENIVNIAIQEGVDIIGLSSYSAGHMRLVPEVFEHLRKADAEDILLIVGGIIPHVDIPILKKIGVAEVFPPGSSVDKIVDYIKANVK